MSTLFPLGMLDSMEEFMSQGNDCNNGKIITRNFDPKLLFLGHGNEPLQLCQKLLETVIDHPVFYTSRPCINVPSLMPNAMEHLPATTRSLQVVTLGNKFNWRANEQEALFFVTDYDTLRLEGTKTRREIGIEDFMEDQKLSREYLFGVIHQSKEPLWLSSLHSAEIFNFRKRLATVLKIPLDRVFWVKNVKHCMEFLESIMWYIYRWRTDKECEVKYDIKYQYEHIPSSFCI